MKISNNISNIVSISTAISLIFPIGINGYSTIAKSIRHEALKHFKPRQQNSVVGNQSELNQ